MPKTKKKSLIKTKKVWRIFHFSERFEMPENMRKCRISSLVFTRDFVGDAGGDEAVGYQHQFRLLYNGDGVEYCQLYGLYRQLVNLAAKRSRAYRGYLLDAKNQPLTDSQIAKILHIDYLITKKMLRKLASVDLLERVDIPIFDLSVNTLPPNDEEGGRNKADPGGGKRKPLKKRQNGKKEKRKSGKDKSGREKINGKSGKDKTKPLKGEKQRPVTKTTSAPTTTPESILSQASDAGGAVIPFHAPPGSANHNRQPQRLGDITKDIVHKLDPDAKTFGYELYKALSLPWEPISVRGRRELGCFAALWIKAKTSIPLACLEEFRGRVIEEAYKVAKRRGKCGNVSAVWCTIFNKILDKYCSDICCKVM